MPENYQDLSRGVTQMGQTAQNLAVMLARQRYQQQMAQQQMALRAMQQRQQEELYRQHGDLYEAQAGEAGAREKFDLARTADLGRASQVRGNLGAALQAFPLILPENVDQQQQYAGEIMSGIGQLPANQTTGLPEKLAQMLLMSNPRMRALIATGAKPIQSAPSQSILTDVITGDPRFIAPQKLPQGTGLYPGTGGPALSLNPPNPLNVANNNAQWLGSLQNTLGHYKGLTGKFDTNNPTVQALQGAISQVLAQEQARRGTNQLDQQVPEVNDVPMPMPRDKSLLRPGIKYQTSRGPATWDGTQFIQ